MRNSFSRVVPLLFCVLATMFSIPAGSLPGGEKEKPKKDVPFRFQNENYSVEAVAESGFVIRNNVRDLAVSGNGDVLAVYTDKKELFLFSHPDGKQVAKCAMPDGVRSLSLSEDGKSAVWISQNKAYNWTPSEAAEPKTIDLKIEAGDTYMRIACMNDGKSILCMSNTSNSLDIIPWNDPKKGKNFSVGNGINSMTVSADGTRIAVACNDNFFIIWNSKDGEIAAKSPDLGKPVTLVKFVDGNPDVLLSMTNDGAMRYFDVKKQKMLGDALKPAKDGYTEEKLLCAKGKCLIVRQDNNWLLWRDGKTKSISREMLGIDSMGQLLMHPSGDFLYYTDFEQNSQIRCFDLKKMKPQELGGTHHVGPVAFLAFSSNGKTLVSFSQTGEAKCIFQPLGKNGKTELLLSTAQNGDCLAAHPDGKRFATIATRLEKPCVSFVDRETRKENGKDAFFVGDKLNIPSRLAISPTGKGLAEYHGQIHVWDTETKKVICKLADSNSIECMTYLPDGAGIAAASSTGLVCVWDSAKGNLIKSFQVEEKTKRLLALPDGKHLILGGERGGLRMYDILTGKPVLEYKGYRGEVLCLLLAPDKKSFYSGTLDGIINQWNFDSDKEIEKIRNVLNGDAKSEAAPVTSMAFSEDGTILAIGNKFGGIMLYRRDK